METKWIEFNKRKPKKGGEYNVVWNIGDGKYPIVTTMDYDAITKKWTDVICNNMPVKDKIVLYWAKLPKPPKGIKKSVYK